MALQNQQSLSSGLPALCQVVTFKSYREGIGNRSGGDKVVPTPKSNHRIYFLGRRVLCLLTMCLGFGSRTTRVWIWAPPPTHQLTDWDLQDGQCQRQHCGHSGPQLRATRLLLPGLIDPCSSLMMPPSTLPVRVPEGSGQGQGRNGGRGAPGLSLKIWMRCTALGC